MKKQVFEKIPVQRTILGKEAETVDFLLREQYLNADLWRKFVEQYRLRLDGDTVGWRGEFWGKAMRGAAMVYDACRDEALMKAAASSRARATNFATCPPKVCMELGFP